MPRAAIGLTALLAACAARAPAQPSSEDEEAPAACLAGADTYPDGPAGDPAEVLLDGETPISDCLTPEQEGGQLAAIGKEMIAAATKLSAAAQEDPGGPEALQLGYLIGAVERESEGIPPTSGCGSTPRRATAPMACFRPKFERTFGQGYAAGLESG